MKYYVKLEGVSPLLLHRNSREMEELLKKAKNNEAREKIERENYLLYLYRDKNGQPCLPSLNLIRCFTIAGTEFRQEGKGKKSYKNIIGGGLVFIEEQEIPIRYEGEIEPFETFVKIQQNRCKRVRPLIRKWSLEFTLHIADGVDPEKIQEIIVHAGAFVGIGDFRPERGGPFGRFRVVKFEPAE